MSIDVHYVTDGPADAPVIVLSGSLGSTLDMWSPQVEALASEFRLVRYDLRGHGESPVPDGPYSLAELGADALRLFDRIGAERVCFAGLSLGGMVGMWLGANAPERIDRLAVMCTSARFAPPEAWAQRAELVRAEGTSAVAPGVVQRWFTPGFAEQHPEVTDRMRTMVAGTPAEGYAGCCNAIEHADLHPDLPRIAAPTLVVAGADDPASPPDHVERIASGVKGARLQVVDSAAHLASWERADRVNELLREHFSGTS
ncbi:3-oxoadipate enol-lactonase [Lipingzhangella halophila]|uniref:3-oxoadipate enol-lactonase n=1 Tax=Lipingzhangella halophila TaxID=1783352 RepID=A0A7W7W244_9ACTN|nr:3-oxoadipate enol-lactonase [Lipingzhangella halophila]MBB4930389.1 3-oxoadipate enol-lactonase [Lipingzhangella halophila]